jgi:hypothetical protein
MIKKGPLGKAEKFYIEHHLDLPLDDLCKDLNRAKSVVEKYIDKIPAYKKEPKAAEETKEPVEKKETLLYKQFARNDRGSTVMTQNASEMADTKRGQFGKKGVQKNCVTKIR